MPTHAEKRVLPHTPEQMFDLVADIEKYPEFLPWCVATRIRERQGEKGKETLISDMVIGFKIFREKFTSKVVCDRPRRVDVSYYDGPFKYLNNHWLFAPHGEGKCEIDFFVDFEFKSKLLQKAIGVVFGEAVKLMISAFEKRANALYGGDEKG
ncbi:MAG: type II toxin-antitoxin system RatA family toxin [Rhodospirillales bacterium]|nr:type II toxin-antitoxin system RatA family toxin [Rhodospirillales bacterium]